MAVEVERSVPEGGEMGSGQPQLLETTARWWDMSMFIFVGDSARVLAGEQVSRMRGEVGLASNVLRVDRRGPELRS